MISKISNRKFLTKVIVGAVFGAAILSVATPVNALEEQDYIESIQNCQSVADKLESKTEEFTTKRQDHLDRYTHVSGLFSSITSTLNAAGYPAGLLVELQPGLDRRITKFAEASQIFLNEMTDAADSTCRDKASFKQELDEARNSLKDVQLSVSSIHEYINNIVVDAINDVIEGQN